MRNRKINKRKLLSRFSRGTSFVEILVVIAMFGIVGAVVAKATVGLVYHAKHIDVSKLLAQAGKDEVNAMRRDSKRPKMDVNGILLPDADNPDPQGYIDLGDASSWPRGEFRTFVSNLGAKYSLVVTAQNETAANEFKNIKLEIQDKSSKRRFKPIVIETAIKKPVVLDLRVNSELGNLKFVVYNRDDVSSKIQSAEIILDPPGNIREFTNEYGIKTFSGILIEPSYTAIVNKLYFWLTAINKVSDPPLPALASGQTIIIQVPLQPEYYVEGRVRVEDNHGFPVGGADVTLQYEEGDIPSDDIPAGRITINEESDLATGIAHFEDHDLLIPVRNATSFSGYKVFKIEALDFYEKYLDLSVTFDTETPFDRTVVLTPVQFATLNVHVQNNDGEHLAGAVVTVRDAHTDSVYNPKQSKTVDHHGNVSFQIRMLPQGAETLSETVEVSTTGYKLKSEVIILTADDENSLAVTVEDASIKVVMYRPSSGEYSSLDFDVGDQKTIYTRPWYSGHKGSWRYIENDSADHNDGVKGVLQYIENSVTDKMLWQHTTDGGSPDMLSIADPHPNQDSYHNTHNRDYVLLTVLNEGSGSLSATAVFYDEYTGKTLTYTRTIYGNVQPFSVDAEEGPSFVLYLTPNSVTMGKQQERTFTATAKFNGASTYVNKTWSIPDNSYGYLDSPGTTSVETNGLNDTVTFFSKEESGSVTLTVVTGVFNGLDDNDSSEIVISPPTFELQVSCDPQIVRVNFATTCSVTGNYSTQEVSLSGSHVTEWSHDLSLVGTLSSTGGSTSTQFTASSPSSGLIIVSATYEGLSAVGEVYVSVTVMGGTSN